MTERVRWRITLAELCHACRTTPQRLEHWAKLGAFGPRWQERRDRGAWRHITRDVADRAVLMARLTQIGVSEELAVEIVQTHRHGPTEPLVYDQNGVNITVSREDLP